jgi:hypothetical protein
MSVNVYNHGGSSMKNIHINLCILLIVCIGFSSISGAGFEHDYLNFLLQFPFTNADGYDLVIITRDGM